MGLLILLKGTYCESHNIVRPTIAQVRISMSGHNILILCNKKLLVTSASLLLTSALLVETRTLVGTSATIRSCQLCHDRSLHQCLSSLPPGNTSSAVVNTVGLTYPIPRWTRLDRFSLPHTVLMERPLHKTTRSLGRSVSGVALVP